eukprot:PLAT16037.2.p1 GENE.PLAT16037.2~~PLAT16037.2.p1  ORF type:complete len:318 (+),score=89.74 PLAT16037.2:27-956(+)
MVSTRLVISICRAIFWGKYVVWLALAARLLMRTRWFVREWCGWLCILLAYGAIVSVDYAVTLFSVMPWWRWKLPALLHFALFQTLVALVLWAHTATQLNEPGIQPAGVAESVLEEDDNMDTMASATELSADVKQERKQLLASFYCKTCGAEKGHGTHHCSICNACVRRMDHHCPWVNNCVGERTQKPFILFLLYICLAGLYAFVMLVWAGVHCTYQPHDCERNRWLHYDANYVIFCILAGIVAAFFAIFVTAMGCDQWEALTSTESYIDSLKGYYSEPRPLREGMRETCGPLSWSWLLPVLAPPVGKES